MPTWVQVGAQDGSKTSPRPKKRDAETMNNRGLCWEPPRRRGTPSDRAPKSDGVPLLGSVFGSFFIDFWFALDLHFIGILTGSFQEFSKSNPEMKASSWKIVAATRALVSPERRLFWIFFNDKSQVKRGGGHAA